ncbi:Flavin-dependent trigonelline monooxygenase, oxygenase component [Paenibacillus solanacearum]|uniref:Flavin-dependent trigonelline monooxygenase, oxygenase component n=1 Tax=Paenibacillus solanacearum TaxID=2048548 RepID=A0A916JVE4_9BACL|nr:MsnO8 family LLM class oxidoreductase [Paenibacillus solanacearum]CAG7603662.1 Flavin-dependent trigonelline monooxygenase, oxygenase component [Paenibacillus solanacearum]
MKLSVLDLAPVFDGADAAGALAQASSLAQAAERAGYHRYWVAEHHDMPRLACTSPEVLLSHIGARTKTIRIGSGATLLPHYKPIKVAESFHMLSSLYPGRVDLGIGRAPGGSAHVMMALSGNFLENVRVLPQSIRDLTALLANEYVHEGEPVTARPLPPVAPEVWMLGTNRKSAAYAAEFGTGYVFGQFMSNLDGSQVLASYRENFRPSRLCREPRAIVAIGVICADSEEEAQRWAAEARRWFQPEPDSPDAAFSANAPSMEAPANATATFPDSRHRQEQASAPVSAGPASSPAAASGSGRLLVGRPDDIRSRLEELSSACGTDEFLIVTLVPDYACRLRSYELLAKAVLG